MPNYDYKCLKCKKKFEQFQRMSDKPLAKCIYCKGRVERLIGAGAGLIFKGSGFYATDYKKKSEGKKPEDKKSEKPSESSPKKEKDASK